MKYRARRTDQVSEREMLHAEQARRMAAECMVLMKNDGHALPIKKGARIALFGNGARATVRGGTGSGEVNSRTTVNVEEGLLDAGCMVVSTQWLSRQEAYTTKAVKEYQAWAAEEAERRDAPLMLIGFTDPYKEPEVLQIEPEEMADADAALYVISRSSGEGRDRRAEAGDYYLSGHEKENLRRLAARYDRVILVLNIGGVMDLEEALAGGGVKAVLLMTQLGNLGGNALAEVLCGDVTPSGKLTDTWARSYTDYPSAATYSHNNGNVDDEDYAEDIFVGYRYFDTFSRQPLFPFGFGLSYTQFTIGQVHVRLCGQELLVRACVTNTGSVYAGKEVVQVYVSAPGGGLPHPYQELRGFDKTRELAPGAAQEVEISIPVASFACYAEADAAWVLEAGDYIVRVGASSADTQLAAVVHVPSRLITRKVKNLFPVDRAIPAFPFAEEAGVPQMFRKPDVELPDGLQVLTVDPAAFQTEETVYSARSEFRTEQTGCLTLSDVREGTCTVEELVSQLTVHEMAQLCVGTLRSEGGSIVGNASATVPGAAGDTSQVCLESRGIPGLIMADGPAGLRLTPHFRTGANGELLPDGERFESVEAGFTDGSAGAVDYYQYCTAIPIGWGLAHSFNLPLIEEMGDLIGEEMEEYGIHLWLAPALNIHRNPLCGRNFEYYSEDPLVSGKVAAAITRGVQRHRGCGTTIKHFACNSQEENRYFTNAHISERAIRELYLRGFEIAVREAQPAAIMTSYNLINGVHAANSYDLIQCVARDEWGYEGVVISDWFSSQDVPFTRAEHEPRYPIASSTGCIRAGNDIQMPGCEQNVTDIVRCIEDGREVDGVTLTLADLQFCAANVIRCVLRLT